MKRRIDDCISSQRSPKVACFPMRKPVRGSYPSMFVQDICASFSFGLAHHPLKRDREFYRVEPSDDTLKDFLTLEDFMFFDRNMDQLLTGAMEDLVSYGKAYLEIVSWRDTEGNVKGISFAPVKPLIVLKGRGKTLFASVLYNRKLKWYCIENRNYIVLRLKDLGFSRIYMQKLMKKIKQYDLTSVTDMSLDPEKIGFDFSEYIRKSEYNLLKTTKRVYWYGRNGENQYLSESYMLYRAAKFKMLRKEFLNYMIQQINMGLNNHKIEIGFCGKLVVDCEDIEYLGEFEKLWAGNINISQLSKQIFRI